MQHRIRAVQRGRAVLWVAKGSEDATRKLCEDGREECRRRRAQWWRHCLQLVASCEATVTVAEACGRPRALVAAVAAAAVGHARDVKGDVVALVVPVLEATLAHDTCLVADLARPTLPDDITERKGSSAHALRRLAGQALDGRGRGLEGADAQLATGHLLLVKQRHAHGRDLTVDKLDEGHLGVRGALDAGDNVHARAIYACVAEKIQRLEHLAQPIGMHQFDRQVGNVDLPSWRHIRYPAHEEHVKC